MINFKRPQYESPDKMRVETEHMGFNRHAVLIAPGNLVSKCQQSSEIRAKSMLYCGGRAYAPGELRELDLRPFGQLPGQLRKSLMRLTDERPVYLYRFQSPNIGWRPPTVHGYVVTDLKTHELLYRVATGKTYKSTSVIEWCVPYITPYEPPANF